MEENNMKHRSRKFRDWQKDKHITRKERILKSYLPDGLPKEINASDVLKVYDFLDGFEYREKGKFGQIYLFYRLIYNLFCDIFKKNKNNVLLFL